MSETRAPQATHDLPVLSVDGDWSGQLVATAVHAGHDLRPEVHEQMVLDEEVRLREEDPFTDRFIERLPARLVVHRSRFETDLNRVREEAVYREPEDAWGLDMWRGGRLPDDIAERSLEVFDEVYDELGRRFDEIAARGPFVVYDVHSYNHRRDGADGAVADPADNPEVNLGTGTVDERFRPVVEAFRTSLSAQEVQGHRLDVRENVKFEGRALAWWVHERYAGRGVCLALEFKKTFMDEWNGVVDEEHLGQLRDALGATHEPVLQALRRLDGA
jgi:hypothetical protein